MTRSSSSKETRAGARSTPRTQALAALPNLGPRSVAALAKAGISTVAQLRRAGAVQAYLRVKRVWPGASLNLLYALAGALDGADWREVKRTRKSALLAELSAAQEAATRAPQGQRKDELLALRNIGPAMRQDFDHLGIRSVKQLARCNADALYARIQRLTHTRHDPCVWDTYAAAIHQARTGEALPWWHFTQVRKQRAAAASTPRARRARTD